MVKRLPDPPLFLDSRAPKGRGSNKSIPPTPGPFAPGTGVNSGSHGLGGSVMHLGCVRLTRRSFSLTQGPQQPLQALQGSHHAPHR